MCRVIHSTADDTPLYKLFYFSMKVPYIVAISQYRYSRLLLFIQLYTTLYLLQISGTISGTSFLYVINS